VIKEITETERERDRDRDRVMEVQRVLKPQPKKNLWKPEEDLILKNYVEAHGEGNWATVSERSGSKTSLYHHFDPPVIYSNYIIYNSLSLSLSLSLRFDEGWEELQA
jgi:hypothetical protein